MSLPQYVEQPIHKNFRLEIWNTSQGVASQSGPLVFYTSKLGFLDYRWGTDYTLATADAPCTSFSCSLANNNTTLVILTGTSTGGVIAGTYFPAYPTGTVALANVWLKTGIVTIAESPYQINSIIFTLTDPIENLGTWTIYDNNGVASWVSSSTYYPFLGPVVVNAWTGIGIQPSPHPTIANTTAGNLPFIFPSNSVSETN